MTVQMRFHSSKFSRPVPIEPPPQFPMEVICPISPFDMIVISSDEEDHTLVPGVTDSKQGKDSRESIVIGLSLDNPINVDDSDSDTLHAATVSQLERGDIYKCHSRLTRQKAESPNPMNSAMSFETKVLMPDEMQDETDIHYKNTLGFEADVDDNLDISDSDTDITDWGYVENLGRDDIKASDQNVSALSSKTRITKGNSLVELLECIEMYDESVRVSADMITAFDEAAHSGAESTLRLTRGGSKRRQSDLDTRINVPHKRPYVPYCVWLGSTWEDWAQLEQGDWLHWPFESWEDDIIADIIEQFLTRPKKRHSAALIDNDELWQTVAVHLATRRAVDCRRHWIDVGLGVKDPHSKPVLVTKAVNMPRRPTMYELVAAAKYSRSPHLSNIDSNVWWNLGKERTFGEGSADTFAVQVIHSKGKFGFKVAAGSACNSQPEYNLPGNLRLWSSETGTVTQLQGHKTEIQLRDGTKQDIWHTITDIKASPDKRFIYSASHDKCAKVWCADTGNMLSTLCYHEKELHQIAVKPSEQENILATGSKDGTAVIWRMNHSGRFGTGVICELGHHEQEALSVETLAFGVGPSEHLLFTGVAYAGLDSQGLIESFDLATGNASMRYQTMDGAIADVSVSYSGRYVVSGNYGLTQPAGDGFIHVNDIRTPKSVIKGYTGHADVNIIRMSPCETYVASGDTKNEVAVVDIRRPNNPLYRLRHLRKWRGSFHQPCSVIFHEPRSMKRELQAVTYHSVEQMSQHLVPMDSDMGITGMHWLSDSKTLITSGGDNSVKVWDIWASGESLRSYHTASNVSSLFVNEDAKVICAGTAGAQGIVYIWTPS